MCFFLSPSDGTEQPVTSEISTLMRNHLLVFRWLMTKKDMLGKVKNREEKRKKKRKLYIRCESRTK